MRKIASSKELQDFAWKINNHQLKPKLMLHLINQLETETIWCIILLGIVIIAIIVFLKYLKSQNYIFNIPKRRKKDFFEEEE